MKEVYGDRLGVSDSKCPEQVGLMQISNLIMNVLP